jgi:hypothetical protein
MGDLFKFSSFAIALFIDEPLFSAVFSVTERIVFIAIFLAFDVAIK